MQIFELQGFELANGRHAPRLRSCHDDHPKGPLERSSLWARAEDSRTEIVSALALPANRAILLALARVPADSNVRWSVRDVGGAGTIDLVANVKRSSGGDVLLLVSCHGSLASPARLREQVAQAVRAALEALSNITLDDRPALTRLVVLSGWRRGVPVPTEARPLPALQREPAILESVPEPQVWGYLPFVQRGHDRVFLALGSWSEFDEEPWIGLGVEPAPLPWQRWEPTPIAGFGPGAAIELEQHQGRVRVSLRLKSSAHKASMKQDKHGNSTGRRVRALRAACYSGHLHVGAGRFVGESIEQGVPRLHWDWAEGQAPSAEAARTEVVVALSRFAGVAAAAPPGGSNRQQLDAAGGRE